MQGESEVFRRYRISKFQVQSCCHAGLLDTCVLYSALRSSSGASFRVVSALPSKKFQPIVSTPVFFEYEEVLLRTGQFPHLATQDVEDFLDYIASVCEHRPVNFLWRPFLRDADDHMILEAAGSGGAEAIITYNFRDFAGSEQFRVRVISPADFIHEIHL